MRVTLESELHPEQRSIVQLSSSESLAVPGRAGTGKTTTAIYRLIGQLQARPDQRRVTIISAFNHMTLYYMKQLLSRHTQGLASVNVKDALTTNELDQLIDKSFASLNQHSTVILCTNHLLARLVQRKPPQEFGELYERAVELVGTDILFQLIFDEAQSLSIEYIKQISKSIPEKIRDRLITEFYWDPNQEFKPLGKDGDGDSSILTSVAGVSSTLFTPAFSSEELKTILPKNRHLKLEVNQRNTDEIANLVNHLSLKLPLPTNDGIGERIERHGSKPQIDIWPDNLMRESLVADPVLDRLESICKLNPASSVGVIVVTQLRSKEELPTVYSSVAGLAAALRSRPDIADRVIEYDSSVGTDIRRHKNLSNHIWVMSVRSSRGLEFDTVIVPNAIVSKAPNPRWIAELYTAVSRPRSGLNIMSDNSSQSFLIGDSGLISDPLLDVNIQGKNRQRKPVTKW